MGADSVPVKLLFFLDSLRFGGAERQTVDLINGLDPRRFSVSLCCFRDDDHLRNRLLPGRVDQIYWLHKRGRADVGLMARIWRVVHAVKPNLVCCVNTFALPFVHGIRIMGSIKFSIVGVMHSDLTHFLTARTDRIVGTVFSPFLKRSDQAIFVCDAQRQGWIERFGISPHLSRVIHNGIDISHFRPRLTVAEKQQVRCQLELPATAPVICMCAAFRQEKRQDHLVTALGRMREQGSRACLLLVGDGPERQRVEEYAASLGLKDRVRFVGYQPDVREYLEVADVVVNYSDAETFPLAVLEAMAMGKAVVCSEVGGAREQVLAGNNGYLCPPGNPEWLASNLLSVLNGGDAHRLGDNSRLMVEQRFGMGTMVASYENCFLEMTQEKTPAGSIAVCS